MNSPPKKIKIRAEMVVELTDSVIQSQQVKQFPEVKDNSE